MQSPITAVGSHAQQNAAAITVSALAEEASTDWHGMEQRERT
jgi:hypothetical protein